MRAKYVNVSIPEELAKKIDEYIKKLEKIGIVKTNKTVRKTNVFIDPYLLSILKKRK